MSTTRVVVVMVILMFGLAMSGCVQPGEYNGNDTNGSVPVPSPTPDPTPEALPDPIPTVTPTPDNDIGNESNGSDDKLNWSTCDPRHNESWLYLHKCGKYASSGGGGSYPDPDPDPCEGVECYPQCFGGTGLVYDDLYNTTCVNGECVQGDLVEANSTCCQRPDTPIPELPTMVALVVGITFLLGYKKARRQ